MGSIGLDHCEVLGKTLKQIALEKAGVISQNSIVVSASQHPIVAEVLKKRILQKGAKLIWVSPLDKDWELGLPGNIQRENAAVAKGVLQALTTIGWKINEKSIRKGFANAYWPGRLQSATWNNLPLLIDGAHNPLAAEILSKERERWSGNKQGIVWILGIQTNKDGPSILNTLIKELDTAWIVPVPGHNSWTKFQLSKHCSNLEAQIFQAKDVPQVLSKISTLNQWPEPKPVITGSLYLIGNLMKNHILKLK